MEEAIVKDNEEECVEEATAEVTEAPLEEVHPQEATPKKHKKKRKKFYQYTLEDDIRYKAPLNFRHLRILAWVLLFLTQAGLILGLIFRDAGPEVVQPLTLLSSLSALTMPLFMLANFALILRERQTYIKQLLSYAALAGLFIFIYYFFFLHIYFAVGDLLVGDRELLVSSIQMIVGTVAPGGYLAFNIFMDLFLCTLFAFFLNYRPTKVFKGKAIYIFRWMCLLPIIYEVVTLGLKFASAASDFNISPYFYPFLPTKPPVMFLVFIALTLYIKSRERIFIKKGNKTHEEYNAFLSTRANSFHFSRFTSIIFLLGAALDLFLLIVSGVLFLVTKFGEEAEITLEMALSAFNTAYKLGFGQTVPIVLLIPVMLLFSYTKGKKDQKLDMIVPAVGVGSIALLYFEAGFFTLILFIADKIGTIDIF